MKEEAPKYQLDRTPEKYFELWQFFASRGDAYKDKMWSITIWLYALLAGILGYMMNNFMGSHINQKNDSSLDIWLIAEPVLCIIFSVFAILFCTYIIVTIKEYGNHVQGNWNRANYLLSRIDNLPAIWFSGLSENEITKKLENQKEDMKKGKSIRELSIIPRRLIYLTYGFMSLFIIIIIFSVIELNK